MTDRDAALPQMTRCPGFDCKAKHWCRRWTERPRRPGEDWFDERPPMTILDPPCVVWLSDGTVRDE